MRRGFTMVELVIVMTLLAIVTPLMFLVFRVGASDFQRANTTLEVTEQIRSLSEELRLDARNGRLRSAGLTFDGPSDCHPVSYELVGATVIRRTSDRCGNQRVLVTHVTQIQRTGPLLTLSIAQLPEDPRVSVVIPLAESQ